MADKVRLFSVPWHEGGNDFPAIVSATLIGLLNSSNYPVGKWDGTREFTVSTIKGDYFELPISMGEVKSKVNYCYYIQDSAIYFAFVNRMEWTSANSTRFYFTIDYVTTYIPRVKIGGYRTRKRLAPDETPTSVLNGDFIGNYKFPVSKKDFLFDGNFLNKPPYVLAYLNPSIEGGGDDLFAPYSNIYSQMVLALNYVDLGYFMAMLAKGDSVAESVQKSLIDLYLVPPIFTIPTGANWSIGGHSYPMIGYGNPVGSTQKPLMIGTYTLSGNSNNIFWNNNDTECVIVADGREIKLSPSELDAPEYDIYLTLASSPALAVYPRWKKEDKSRSIVYSNFPQLGLSVDQYSNWQQRNMLNLISQSVAVGTRFLMGDYLGGAISGVNTVTSQLAYNRNAQTQTPFSTAQQSTAIQSAGFPFLSIQTRCWQNASTAGLAYYSREGFPCLEYGTIDVMGTNPGNGSYDYYKCSDLTISGVPAEAQRVITETLERGVRLWNTVNIS